MRSCNARIAEASQGKDHRPDIVVGAWVPLARKARAQHLARMLRMSVYLYHRSGDCRQQLQRVRRISVVERIDTGQRRW
jgi:hypothetical protein